MFLAFNGVPPCPRWIILSLTCQYRYRTYSTGLTVVRNEAAPNIGPRKNKSSISLELRLDDAQERHSSSLTCLHMTSSSYPARDMVENSWDAHPSQQTAGQIHSRPSPASPDRCLADMRQPEIGRVCRVKAGEAIRVSIIHWESSRHDAGPVVLIHFLVHPSIHPPRQRSITPTSIPRPSTDISVSVPVSPPDPLGSRSLLLLLHHGQPL